MSDIKDSIATVAGVPEDLLDPSNSVGIADRLAPILRQTLLSNSTDELLESMQELEAQKEADIRAIAESPDNPFREVVEYLDFVQTRTDSAADSVRIVGEQIQRSGSQLVAEARVKDQYARTRMNIESSLDTIQLCLRALDHTNQVHTLLKTNNKVAAVHSLGELRSMGLERLLYLGLANVLTKAVPGLTRLIMNAMLDSLASFSHYLDADAEKVGAHSRELLARQKQQWAITTQARPHLQPFRFNSPVELAYRDSGVNFLTDSLLDIDFSSIDEAHLVATKLDRLPDLVARFDQIRAKAFKDLLPQGTQLTQSVLDRIVGVFLIDNAISNRLPDLESHKRVEDSWQQVAQRVAELAGTELKRLVQTNDLILFKSMVATTRDVLENFGFTVGALDAFLRDLLRHFSSSLVDSNRKSFLATWDTADHMPMVINRETLYVTVMGMVWAAEDVEASFTETSPFPRVLPFSEIYPLMCADIRSLITHHSSFFDQFQSNPGVVEDAVFDAVEEYLTNVVCKKIESTLNTGNREQLVQALIDLKYFVAASSEIERLLENSRMSGKKGRITLGATAAFAEAHRKAESNLYELTNSVVDQFIEMADYDWHAQTPATGQSMYASEMASFFLTIANGALVRLPRDLRAFIYLGAADHLNTRLMDLLIGAPDGITTAAIQTFDSDLVFIESFVSALAETASAAGMSTTLMEVRQTVNLLKSEDPTEYNDLQTRLKKFDRVRQSIIPGILGKVRSDSAITSPRTPQTGFMRYLSGDKT